MDRVERGKGRQSAYCPGFLTNIKKNLYKGRSVSCYFEQGTVIAQWFPHMILAFYLREGSFVVIRR